MPPPIAHPAGRLPFALLLGTAFGFLLFMGGATHYRVLMDQLLLRDFSLLQLFLSAVATATVGVGLVRRLPSVSEHRKAGSVGKTLVGGLIFGAGFGLLAYCPGTLAGAIGHGALDALCFGLAGAVLGSWAFALVYPRVRDRIWPVGSFGDRALHELLGWPRPVVILLVVVLLAAAVAGIELWLPT